MIFRNADIRHFAEDAIYFFNETYGLNFSTSLLPNDQHELFSENAKMNLFFFKISNLPLLPTTGFRLDVLTHHAIK